MIANDQPQCFPDDVLVAVSSRSDGTVLDRTIHATHDPSIVQYRKAFVRQAGGDYDTCVYQIILYGDDQTYDTIAEVDRPNGEGVCADALYTETLGVGLFLPVADCVATVVYDSNRRALAVAHLGRHASVARLMTKLVEFMVEKGSAACDLVVWMAPSVGRDSYRMEYFAHSNEPEWQAFAITRDDGVYLDLAGFNASLAASAGILPENIHRSPIDTARSTDYFSHSQGDTSGRFAVIAQMHA